MADTFLNDLDKVYDFLQLSKWEFLESYSYITEEDYDLSMQEFEADKVEKLAYYMRDSENMLIEENTYYDNEDTNPYKGFLVTGEQLKDMVSTYVYENLSKEEQQEFEEWCEGMAC